jgi:hypothetical protein
MIVHAFATYLNHVMAASEGGHGVSKDLQLPTTDQKKPSAFGL